MNIRSFSRIGLAYKPSIGGYTQGASNSLTWAGNQLIWAGDPLIWNGVELGTGLHIRANTAYGFKIRTQGVG